MLRSIVKQSGESVEEEKEGYDGKDLQKRKVFSLQWKSELRGDETGKWTELMEEVPLRELGESELDDAVAS